MYHFVLFNAYYAKKEKYIFLEIKLSNELIFKFPYKVNSLASWISIYISTHIHIIKIHTWMNNKLNLLEFNWIWPSLLRLKITIMKNLTEKTHTKDFLFCLLYRSAISHKCKSSCIVVFLWTPKKRFSCTLLTITKHTYIILKKYTIYLIWMLCKSSLLYAKTLSHYIPWL